MHKREPLHILSPRTAKNNNRSPTRDQEDEKSPCSHISRLPDHIILDIFSKMLTTPLFQCRRVCRTWRLLLSDPDLIRTPTTLSCLLINGSGSTSPKNPKLHGGNFLLELNHNDVVGVARLTSGPKEQIVGSCNGLLCMFHDDFLGKFSVSNPMTGERVWSVPTEASFDSWGFGYSPISNAYKIVLFQQNFKSVKFTVTTVGEGIWRSVEYAPNMRFVSFDSDWIYLNGYLHCVCTYRTQRYRYRDLALSILAFDVEGESFKLLELPEKYINHYVNQMLGRFRAKGIRQLGVWDGRLCITVADNNEMVVWVMKDYGNKDSWTEEFEIRDSHHKLRLFRLLNYEQGRALLLCGHHLYTCAPGMDNGLVRVQVDRIPQIQKAWMYTPSFLSLKDVNKLGVRGP